MSHGDRLREEIVRLREALAPFARIVPSSFYSDEDPEFYRVVLAVSGGSHDFTRADILRARAALSETDRRSEVRP